MLLRTSLCSPPAWPAAPQNDPDSVFHLVWPRFAAFLETITPQGRQLCFQSLSLPRRDSRA